jgi:hypothetical protein
MIQRMEEFISLVEKNRELFQEDQTDTPVEKT